MHNKSFCTETRVHDAQQRLLHSGQCWLMDNRGRADLDVHLEGGDPLSIPRHLEVHVPQGIFTAQDVGKHLELAVLLHDQAHGHTSDHALDGHTYTTGCCQHLYPDVMLLINRTSFPP